MVGYPVSSGRIKLAAGWLIEHSGPEPGKSWKGYRLGMLAVTKSRHWFWSITVIPAERRYATLVCAYPAALKIHSASISSRR